ncbi:MAG TPA: hypothetical protein VGB66_08300 [Longimicrobium sp.]|jgi:hypothetical protein
MPVSRKSTLLLLLAALACGGDAPEPESTSPAVDGEQEVLMEAPLPVLTPAESAAAVAAVARHADSMTRAVMGDDASRPAPKPHTETIEDQIALCETQAGQATGTIREHLLAACKRLEARRDEPQ